MDPVSSAILIIFFIVSCVSVGGLVWLIFSDNKKETKTFQDDNETTEELDNETQISIDNQLQPVQEKDNETQILIDNQFQSVQEKFNTQQQEFNNTTAVYNKNLDKEFEYLTALEIEHNLPQLEEKEKTEFQLEFEKLLDVKQIIDEQLNNVRRIIIDDVNNEDHKDTENFNINDIKANVEEYKEILNSLIENAENEEIKLALEGKYNSYIQIYDYLINNTQKIIDATKIEDTNQQNKTIEQIINTDTMEKDLMNKIIDGDNNYISSLKNDDDTLKNVILWIDSKANGLNDLGNRIINANNNDIFPSPDNNSYAEKNNNQADISSFDLSAMLKELDKD